MNQKDGQFTSSREKLAIGLKLMQERRIKSYLKKGLEQPGNGSKIVKQSDGSPMVKDAMEKSCGN